MSMSVPGNSCRPCRTSIPTSGCLIRLSGECVYYSGSPISGPGINTGDIFNVVVNKLANTIITPTVVTANNGLSVLGTDVVLGQSFLEASNPAILLNSREIPLGGHSLRFISTTVVNSPTLTINPNASVSYVDNSDTNSVVYQVNIQRTGAGRFQFTNTATTNASALYQAIDNLGNITSFGTNSSIFSSNSEPPGVGKLTSSAPNGIFLNAMSATAVLCIAVGGQGLNYVKALFKPTGLLLGDFTSLAPTDNGARLQVIGNQTTSGNTGLGGITTMTAKLHIAAGSATAGTAPIKLTAGTNLTTPENGTFEFDGTNLYFTVGGVRKTVTLV